jgi:non-ribosomal peptide synthetase component F
MTLLAAFDVLLWRMTDTEDIAVGADVANRNQREIENLIGFFVNMLVLRTDLSGDPTFRELTARVRDVTLGAYAHQDVPFQKLVDELQPQRTADRTSLFEVAFVLQNAPMPALTLPGLTITALASEPGMAQFDLILMIEESMNELHCSFIYNRHLFMADTIGEMANHFRNLLTDAVAQPDKPISAIRLLPAELLTGFTPETVPHLHLTQTEMENILLEVAGQ